MSGWVWLGWIGLDSTACSFELEVSACVLVVLSGEVFAWVDVVEFVSGSKGLISGRLGSWDFGDWTVVSGVVVGTGVVDGIGLTGDGEGVGLTGDGIGLVGAGIGLTGAEVG